MRRDPLLAAKSDLEGQKRQQERARGKPLAGELADFLLPDELHQLEPGLTHKLADAFLQSGGDLLQRYMELDLLIAPSGLTLKSADRFLAVDLISFLHSDSPFFETQTHPEPIAGSGGESLLSTD